MASTVPENVQTTNFTKQQNQTVLIAGLTCACFSVLATLITLRWFILMKRTFRHKLIMFLIFSNTSKALWYFIFPIVVFSRGQVASSSGFCQASGFFLSISVEASDFAILVIALHSILYIFHPPARSIENGGLFPWRKIMYSLWLSLPVLIASLAFVDHRYGYATAGTFCYLPRRPIWYRLALSWIPRYFILLLIFAMYAAVYIYVAIKFRSFSNLQESDSNAPPHSNSKRSSVKDDGIALDEAVQLPEPEKKKKKSRFGPPVFSHTTSSERNQPSQQTKPWDEVSFITSKPLRAAGWQPSIQKSGFPVDGRGTEAAALHKRQSSDRLDPASSESRENVDRPTINPQHNGDTITTWTPLPEAHAQPLSPAAQKLPFSPAQINKNDLLRETREAIRKQLRYLFIYPAVYVLVWIFPFAAHCLLYDDYYVRNPVYWLMIVSTCMLSLQAGIDCVIFSWREKPWRHIPKDHRLSIDSIRKSLGLRSTPEQGRSGHGSMAAPDEGDVVHKQSSSGLNPASSSQAASTHWWEAEGIKRKDSVWMGTDKPDTADVLTERSVSSAQTFDLPRVLEPVDESEAEDHIAVPKRGRQ